MAASGFNPQMGMMDAGKQLGQNFWGGFPGIMQGMFGDSGKPYRDAAQAYRPYFNQSLQSQNPFFQQGQQASGQFGDWLKGQQDPSGFINHLMGQYQESPYAHNQQQEAMRTAQNMGSATGLTGSTPMMQQMQQNASNISGQDQNQWLQNVLGINNQYGQGLNQQMQMGQHAGDMLSQLNQLGGAQFGMSSAGNAFGHQQDQGSFWQGLAKMFGG